MEEKTVKFNEVTNEVEVPIDLTSFEVKRLKEKLELFNSNVAEDSKLTFEEFIKLAFEVSLLEEELASKYNYAKLLESEIKQLEEDLIAKYSIGLTGSEEVYNEVIELRKKTLEDSLVYVKNYKSDYISLLVNYIEVIVYSSSYEDGILTLKEAFEEDVEKNPSEVYKAVQIVKDNLDPENISYKEAVLSINAYEEYLNSI